MNPTIVDESKIPEDATQVHLYDPKNVLMPRGSMQKESIGPYLLDRLKDGYESWTDGKYGDNPPLPDLIKFLYTNLMGEVEQAWLAFVESSLSGLSKSDELLLKMSILASTKPKFESESVTWLLETMISEPSDFVSVVIFIDNYERQSPEFQYFTGLHVKFMKNKSYSKMMEEAHTEDSVIHKLFQEVDYFRDSVFKNE